MIDIEQKTFHYSDSSNWKSGTSFTKHYVMKVLTLSVINNIKVYALSIFHFSSFMQERYLLEEKNSWNGYLGVSTFIGYTFSDITFDAYELWL